MRRILRLERNWVNTKIIGVAVLFGCLFWIFDSIIDYLVFNADKQSFLDILILELSPFEIYIRTAFIFASLVGGLLTLKYMQKYKKSEQRFRSIVESSFDWVWEVDKNGFYTYVSPKIKDILGYEPKELIGKTPFDLMPPEEAQRVSTIFQNIVKARQPFTALENTNVHKEGRHINIETNGVPFFDVKGELFGFIGTERDITERKQAEKTLPESEEKFRNLVETINDWLWEIDENNITFLPTAARSHASC